MAEPFLAEIRLFPFNYAPTGWAQCNGQLLNVQQNQALFTLLGTKFGGDGVKTFGLPNLQGRTPIAPSTSIPYATVGGEEAHTLTVNEMPQHTHEATGGSDATTNVATSNVWGTSTLMSYNDKINGSMNAAALATAGGSQPHSNMQPYTVLNYCIATQGIWPPKNN